MVNYRRVVCEVALLGALLAVATAAPTPDCTHKHYDQRQNGTENYRLNIDGVVVAVAPAESIFSALGDMDDLMDLLSLEDYSDSKPQKPWSGQSTSPAPAIQIVPVSIEGEKPLLKPDEKPMAEKPVENKPQEDKPVVAEIPAVAEKPVEKPISDVSMGDDLKIQKKEVSHKKQEKAKRLKNRLAALLLPLLRKTRHH